VAQDLRNGHLANRTGPLVLNAWEASYLLFTFLDPSSDISWLVDVKFVGSTDNPSPLIRRFGLSVRDVFTDRPSTRASWTADHLRNEILDGVMTFQLLAGASRSPVPRAAIRPLRRVNVTTWKTGNVTSILQERMLAIEPEPVNKQINCYEQLQR
jgi:hypothetical protein